MPVPRRVARFNRIGPNKVVMPLAERIPSFGVLTHQGRRSGRTFRTPVNVFRHPGGYIVALTYGKDSDWVRNVMAAGSCGLVTRGRRETLLSPHLVHDETRRHIPALPRFILGLLSVSDFLVLERTDPPDPRDQPTG